MFNIVKVSRPRITLLLAAAGLLNAGAAAAQTAPSLGSDPEARTPDTEWTARTDAELTALVGPIALYPDDLVAVVLPASTFPLQIVQAARLLEQRETDPDLEPDDAWDESVVALLNYPEALTLLNDDLDWTWALGEAVIYQQGDVLDAIQSFRSEAYAAGNLESDDRQAIANDGETITITPAEPEVVYVPYYDPSTVIVRQRYPVYHYYPYAYPVYYYPYPAGYSFGSGFFWGVTTAFAISWHDHFLHVHHHSHYRHPYFGYSYHLPWYARSNVYISVNNVSGYNRWRPGYHHGVRPHHYAGSYRLSNRVVANARANRLPRHGQLADQRRVENRRFDRANSDARARRGTGSTAAIETRVQPRRSMRQDGGRPPAARSGRDIADGSRPSREASTSSGRQRVSSIRAESRFTRPRSSGGERRAESVARSQPARVTAQPSQTRRMQRRVIETSRGVSGSARANAPRVAPRAVQGGVPSARSTPTFGRVARGQAPAVSSRPNLQRERPTSRPQQAQSQRVTPRDNDGRRSSAAGQSRVRSSSASAGGGRSTRQHLRQAR
jgi:hypothetical protein